MSCIPVETKYSNKSQRNHYLENKVGILHVKLSWSLNHLFIVLLFRLTLKWRVNFVRNIYIYTHTYIFPPSLSVYTHTHTHTFVELFASACLFYWPHCIVITWVSCIKNKWNEIFGCWQRVSHFTELASTGASFMMIELYSTLCIRNKLWNCI